MIISKFCGRWSFQISWSKKVSSLHILFHSQLKYVSRRIPTHNRWALSYLWLYLVIVYSRNWFLSCSVAPSNALYILPHWQHRGLNSWSWPRRKQRDHIMNNLTTVLRLGCVSLYLYTIYYKWEKEKIPVTIFSGLSHLKWFLVLWKEINHLCLLMKENYTFCDKDGRESEMGETNFFGTYLLTSTSKLWL